MMALEHGAESPAGGPRRCHRKVLDQIDGRGIAPTCMDALSVVYPFEMTRRP